METLDKRTQFRIQAEQIKRIKLEHEFDSPDRPRAKTKSGPSPKKIPPALPVQSEIASDSGDKQKYKNPESDHEPKGQQGRPRTKPLPVGD